MSWLRQAGGFWVDPQDPQTPIPVESHAPYAWDYLVSTVMTPEEEDTLTNQYISELEQKKQTVVTPPAGEEKVDYKGTGGAEAKAAAEKLVADEKANRVREQFGATNGMGASMALQGMGWVRMSTDDPSMVMVMANDEQSVVAASDAIIAEAANRDLLTLYIGSEPMLSIIPQTITVDLATSIASARAKQRGEQQPAASSSVDVGGLGPWRVAGADKVVSFLPPACTVEHRSSNAHGKQWCVVSAQGKVITQGPSRKWAERRARATDWQQRRKT